MLMFPHYCLKLVDSKNARFRLLYVGGDIELLRALRKVLTEPDYHIVSCPHVGSAILFLQGNPRYDLLMFEHELRGLELTKKAQSLPKRKHVPVVMVTANETVDGFRNAPRNLRVDKSATKQDLAANPEILLRLLDMEAHDE